MSKVIVLYCNAFKMKSALSSVSGVKALLKHGADPNLIDEFSSVHLVARDKHLNSLQGMFFSTCTFSTSKVERILQMFSHFI